MNNDDILKRKIIALKKPLNPEVVHLVKAIILRMSGVERVVINICNIYVTYNTTIVKDEQINKALIEIEAAIETQWFEQLRQRLLKNKDINEASSSTSCEIQLDEIPPDS